MFPFEDDDEEADLKAPVHKRCNYKKSWRDYGFLPCYLPPSVTPCDYLQALYWFCSDAPQKQILKETGLKIKIWNQIRSCVRDLLWLVLQEHAGRVPLGGPGRVVVIDETFFTKKKKNKGLLGEPHKAIKPLSWGSWSWLRAATGACVLIQIPNRKQVTLKREIEQHVTPDSLVFTDRHKSYNFLSRRNSNYVHRAVNHRKGEFTRVERIFGEDVNVTTNAVEGLFGRLKQYLQQRRYRKISKKAYGEVLAEFLWRQRVAAFGSDPFRNLLAEIKGWQDGHPRRPEVPGDIQ